MSRKLPQVVVVFAVLAAFMGVNPVVSSFPYLPPAFAADDSSDSGAVGSGETGTGSGQGGIQKPASTAEPNEVDANCIGNNLKKGIYPSSNPTATSLGGFDFDFSSADFHGVSGLRGSMLLCGSDPTAADGEGFYFQSGSITFPNGGELLHCARPNPAANPNCKRAKGNIPDGAYAGSLIVNLHCADKGTLCSSAYDITDLLTQTYARYDTARDGNTFNHCDGHSRRLIACFRASAKLPDTDVTCGMDITLTKSGRKPANMNLHQPSCSSLAEGLLQSVFTTSVKSLVFCRYANINPDTRCSSANKNWLIKLPPRMNANGFQLTETLSGGSTLSAFDSIS